MEGSDKLKVVIDVPLYDRGRALRHPPFELCKIMGEKREITYEELKVWDRSVKDFMATIDTWRKDVIAKIEELNPE